MELWKKETKKSYIESSEHSSSEVARDFLEFSKILESCYLFLWDAKGIQYLTQTHNMFLVLTKELPCFMQSACEKSLCPQGLKVSLTKTTARTDVKSDTRDVKPAEGVVAPTPLRYWTCWGGHPRANASPETLNYPPYNETWNHMRLQERDGVWYGKRGSKSFLFAWGMHWALCEQASLQFNTSPASALMWTPLTVHQEKSL